MNQRGWQERNEQYLTAAFGWLKDQFVGLAGGSPPADEKVQEPGGVADSGFDVFGDQECALPRLVEKLHPVEPQADGEQRAQDQRRFELQLLLLCIAVELSSDVAQACQSGVGGYGYPTFALAQRLFCNGLDESLLLRAMAADRPLRYFQLIDVYQPDGVSLAESRLSASDWLLQVAQGRHVPDELLTRILVPLDVRGDRSSRPVLPASQRTQVTEVIEKLRKKARAGLRLPLVQLHGPSAICKREFARSLARKFRMADDSSLSVYRLPVDSVPADPADLNIFLRLWERECAHTPHALYLDLHDVELQQTDPKLRVVRQIVDRAVGIVILDTRSPLSTPGRSRRTLEIHKPGAQEQFARWKKYIGAEAAERLAGQFNLDLGTVHRIARSAAGGAGNAAQSAWHQCLRYTRPGQDRLAQKIDVKATLDDLVLPALQRQQLGQIADQTRHRYRVYDLWKFRQQMNRGLGISVLFAGDSGTGKTMAAEGIADQLELPLYRIDLSAVVNKYIGETEKNLRRMFDAFEDGGAVLLFDEADSLFGKRSEVKDSHDRYANIQIDYLLQRLESFGGLAILATNMKNALDQAFLRRLRFVVDFPLPALSERRVIWESVFPAEVFGDPPQVNLDFAKLASFNLTGGNIRTIAVNAAGLAAAEEEEADRVLTMEHLLEATKNEFRKLCRPVNEAEFRWQPTNAGEVANV